jgi:hypothetical protein
MKVVRDLYVLVALVVLMAIRYFFDGGDWVGSVVVAGLFVTWIDTVSKALNKYSGVTNGSSKTRLGVVLGLMILAGGGLVVLMVWNLANSLKWLNNAMVLDELTLAALLVCLEQNAIVSLIGSITGVSRKE